MHEAGARRLRADEHLDAPPPRRRLELVEPPPPVGERRTVRITGQPTPPRRRRSAAARGVAAEPDRIALWAFLLGLFLVFMAVATAGL